MKEKIQTILEELENLKADSKEKVEEIRIKYLSKKGEITNLFEEFKTVPSDMKREFGQKLNELKVKATEKINHLKEKFDNEENNSTQDVDLTLPQQPQTQLGSRHPLSITRNRIIEIFSRIGFTTSDGREV